MKNRCGGVHTVAEYVNGSLQRTSTIEWPWTATTASPLFAGYICERIMLDGTLRSKNRTELIAGEKAK